MSWDVDKKEFYETFAEIESERGIEEAKLWAWSALDWTQKELFKKEDGVKDERADSLALAYREQQGENDTLRAANTVLLKERDLYREAWAKAQARLDCGADAADALREERAAVVTHLRERAIHGAGNIVSVEDACTILADLFERGDHREEKE